MQLETNVDLRNGSWIPIKCTNVWLSVHTHLGSMLFPSYEQSKVKMLHFEADSMDFSKLTDDGWRVWIKVSTMGVIELAAVGRLTID